MFYLLMSTAMLVTHSFNYLSNRTTNERFSRRRTVNESGDGTTVMTESIMTLSDFNVSEESMLSRERLLKKKKKRGKCINCWKMMTHTKIISQKKLYDYLADRSTILETSTLFDSHNLTPGSSINEHDRTAISKQNSQLLVHGD